MEDTDLAFMVMIANAKDLALVCPPGVKSPVSPGVGSPPGNDLFFQSSDGILRVHQTGGVKAYTSGDGCHVVGRRKLFTGRKMGH